MSFLVFDVRNVIGEETVGVKEEKDDGRSLLSRARPNSGEPRRRGGGQGMINDPLSLIDETNERMRDLPFFCPWEDPALQWRFRPNEMEGRCVVFQESKRTLPPLLLIIWFSGPRL